MLIDSNYTSWGEHLIMEITVESVRFILETNLKFLIKN